MKRFNEVFGSGRKENGSFFHVNYIRFCQLRRNSHGFFDFVKDKNERFDERMFDEDPNLYLIKYLNCEAKYGDFIYVVFDYNKNNLTQIEGCYKDPVEAIKFAINLWKEGKDDEIINVIRIKIEPHICIGTPNEYSVGKNEMKDFYNAESPYSKEIFHAWRSKKELNPGGILEVDPEYGQNEEIKNLLLSLNTINKFKL
jgi:hypothetical protein